MPRAARRVRRLEDVSATAGGWWRAARRALWLAPARRMVARRALQRAADAGGHGTLKRCAAYELDVDTCGMVSQAGITSRNHIPSLTDSFRRGFGAGRAGRRRGSR